MMLPVSTRHRCLSVSSLDTHHFCLSHPVIPLFFSLYQLMTSFSFYLCQPMTSFFFCLYQTMMSFSFCFIRWHRFPSVSLSQWHRFLLFLSANYIVFLQFVSDNDVIFLLFLLADDIVFLLFVSANDSVFLLFVSANDIAVLRLERPLTFNSKVSALCLPERTAQLPDQCVVSGWGRDGIGLLFSTNKCVQNLNITTTVLSMKRK